MSLLKTGVESSSLCSLVSVMISSVNQFISFQLVLIERNTSHLEQTRAER